MRRNIVQQNIAKSRNSWLQQVYVELSLKAIKKIRILAK